MIHNITTSQIQENGIRYCHDRGNIFIHARYLLKLVVISITIFKGTIAYAQDKTSEVDKVFSWVTPNTPGCICALSKNGNVVVNRAYGSADLERNVPLTTNSVLDAGSVVKQFVAASILLLVEEGKLSLLEDVHKYIPELPDYGYKITLDHLLTHTSGIRDWTGILPLAEGDPDALTLTLRQRGLNFKPGEEWSYSNSGYVLLKEIVARMSGMSFSDFAKKKFFEPLQMQSTSYHFNMTDIIRNRALAYKKEKDSWQLDMKLENDRGGGGALFSTPSDLLIWNQALTNKRLGTFVTEKLQEPTILNNGRKLSYARGLVIDSFRKGGQLIWHSGGAGGYSTLLGRLPEHGLSIAIMCNADGSARTAYAGRIFNLFLDSTNQEKAAKSSATDNSTVGVNVGDITDRAGIYFSEHNNQPLRLIINNNKLHVAGFGPLKALATDRFQNEVSSNSFMSEAMFELRFVSSESFEIRTKEGEISKYSRVPKTYTPTAIELETFMGIYESMELGSVLEMIPQKGSLLMQFYRNPAKALQLTPVDHDTFMLGMMTVRFIRDKNGKVVGFNYSNPVVRNIEFKRLNGVASQR